MGVKISVIIVNYNGKKFLDDCFESIKKCFAGISYEIVVVDNASVDGSCEYIRLKHPEVRLIESAENLGFGKGNNLGVKNSKGKYLLLLNNDTVLLDHLGPVLNRLEEDATIGAAGTMMLDANRNYLMAAGNFPSPFNLYRLKNIILMGPEFRSGKFEKDEYYVDWLSGAFLMMPRKVYDETGGFDEDYFMYVEDVDLSKRIHDKGYKRIFLPRYSYIHYVGHNKSRDHLLVKGFDLYINKHMQGRAKLLSQCSLTINKAVKFIKSLSS